MKKGKKILIIMAIVIFIIFVGIIGFLSYRYYSGKQAFENLSKLYFSKIEDTQQIGKAQTDVEYNFNCSHSIEYPLIGKDEIDNQIKDIVDKIKEDFVNDYKDENMFETVEKTFQGISYFQYTSYETYLAPDQKMTLIFFENQEVGDSNVVAEKVYTYNFDLKTGKKLEAKDIFKDNYKSKLSEYLKSYFTTNEEYKNNLLDSYEDKISDKEDNLNSYAITNDKLIVYFDKYDVLPGSFGIIKVEIPYDKINDCMKINLLKTTSPIEKDEDISGKYEDVNEVVYVQDTAKLREEDNMQSKELGTLNISDKIIRTGIGDNGWSKVDYNGKDAYIYTSYLSTEEPGKNISEVVVDKKRSIDKSKPMVALTFDDGPNPKSTPIILNTLKKYNSVATFFDLGTCMANYPKISKQEEDIGCEVGSHTYGHKNLNTLSQAQILSDISKAEKIYENTLGHKISLVRTPYGNANSTVKATVKYPLINWDVDTLDWKSRNAKSVLAEIHKYDNLDGRVILMHSIYTSTAEAVETLVPELVSKGYQLVTVSELAKYRGVSLQSGKTYYDFRK